MANTSSQLAKPGALYQCHKRVQAFCIGAIEPFDQDGDKGYHLVPDDENVLGWAVRQAYMDKHKPEVGGYFVLYQDGYESFSPAAAFEQGYALVTE